MKRRAQGGFTLIELMVALVVSSLLVGMILAIFQRMSLAYRGQQQIAGVQQVLAAARATMELDAKQAGLEMSQGFKIAIDGPAVLHSPITQINSSTGPDQIAFFYADTSTSALITGFQGPWAANSRVDVDTVAGFAEGDLAILAVPRFTMQNPLGPPGTMANITTFDTCVLQIDTGGSGISGTRIRFTQNAPWGNAGQTHCTVPVLGSTMIYKLIAHGYRIDQSTPVRAALGPLQQSPTGGLLNSVADGWTDLAYGFTDIQTAMQFWDTDGFDTLDADADPARDWYSDINQQTLTQPQAAFASSPLQMSISLVARTDRDVEGISTAATPALMTLNPALGGLNNNTIGDRPSVVLPSATDDALKGFRIYRFTTFQVDLRNMGVGR